MCKHFIYFNGYYNLWCVHSWCATYTSNQLPMFKLLESKEFFAVPVSSLLDGFYALFSIPSVVQSFNEMLSILLTCCHFYSFSLFHCTIVSNKNILNPAFLLNSELSLCPLFLLQLFLRCSETSSILY